jgi:hypothetical protein
MSCARNWLTRREAIELAGALAVMAMIPENPVVGGTVLRRQAIQSPNFLTGVSGWAINQDGSAEFNNVVIRNGQVVSGTALYYSSSPPALGNLVASVSAAAGTDSKGNAYLAGVASYQPNAVGVNFAVSMFHNAVNFFTGPAASNGAGPWTNQGSLGLDINATNQFDFQNFAAVNLTQVMNALFGLVVSSGLTADTVAVSSGQAAGGVLQVTNTTGGATNALIRAFMAAAGDTGIAFRITGDTNSRIVVAAGAASDQINFGPGNGVSDAQIGRFATANLLAVKTADFAIDTVGRGLQIKEGTNAKMGTATLSGGTVVVNTTAVTASSRIFLTAQTTGAAPGALRVSARTAGTSFTITSTSGTDTSVVAWMLVEPAP